MDALEIRMMIFLAVGLEDTIADSFFQSMFSVICILQNKLGNYLFNIARHRATAVSVLYLIITGRIWGITLVLLHEKKEGKEGAR